MKKLFCLCWLFCVAATAAAAEDVLAGSAQPDSVSSIVAVVNDDVISSLDLENRMRLVFATTQLQDTPEVREHLVPQLLRSMIDEKLQLQEAKKNGIDVPQADVDRMIAGIEEQRGIPPGGMLAHLDALGVPRSAFLDQVRARVAWTKLILKTVRPKVKVTDDEIDRERARSGSGSSAPEVNIEVLALPVDRPERDAQVRQLADKLADGVRGGAPFESVAQEFGGAGAVRNIAPFWMPLAQLDPAIAAALQSASPGALVGPVRTPDGYTLVRLLDRRQEKTTVAMTPGEAVIKDIMIKPKPGTTAGEAGQLGAVAEEVAKNPGTCSQPDIAVNPQGADIQAVFRQQPVADLPPQVRDIVGKLQVGGVSEPYSTPEGIRLFMLCERLSKPSTQADRELIANRLLQQKLELEAEKYLRNLRRQATIDVRL